MEHIPTKYGYARESTNEEKQNIAYQIKYLKANGVDDENIYQEYASGANEDRVEYNKLLKQLQPKDSLYVTEISRLSRSTKQLIEMINYVKDNHLQLVIGSLNVDCRDNELDPMVKGMLQMMSVFAELERDIISQRVKEGMANAKNVGRPKFGEDNIPEKFYKYYTKFKSGSIESKIDLSNILGVSRPTLDKFINFVENQKGPSSD